MNLDTLKLQFQKKAEERRCILESLDIKFDRLHEFRRILDNCVSMLKRNGATDIDDINILCVCAKRMLEQVTEVDFSKKLQLITTNLENLMYHSLSISRQIRNDTKHFANNTDGIFTAPITIVENIIVKDSNTIEDHEKILLLNKKVQLKKSAIQKIKKRIAIYEGVPPDIKMARKMLEETQLKLDNLNIELGSEGSVLDGSTFSPS